MAYTHLCCWVTGFHFPASAPDSRWSLGDGRCVQGFFLRREKKIPKCNPPSRCARLCWFKGLVPTRGVVPKRAPNLRLTSSRTATGNRAAQTAFFAALFPTLQGPYARESSPHGDSSREAHGREECVWGSDGPGEIEAHLACSQHMGGSPWLPCMNAP